MGEKLDSMIKALEQRMDSGVLHDLNATRLHMLIGKELVKSALDLPDTDSIISIIEKAMVHYFSPSAEADGVEENVAEAVAENPVKEAPQTQVKFRLNVAKNKENNHAFINKVPVIFSPLPLKQALLELLHSTVDAENPGYLDELKENISFENTQKLINDIYGNLGSVSEKQKIRLGLVVFRLLGHGDIQSVNRENFWEFQIKTSDFTDKYFFLGFIKAIFSAVYNEKSAMLEYIFKNNGETLEVSG